MLKSENRNKTVWHLDLVWLISRRYKKQFCLCTYSSEYSIRSFYFQWISSVVDRNVPHESDSLFHTVFLYHWWGRKWFQRDFHVKLIRQIQARHASDWIYCCPSPGRKLVPAQKSIQFQRSSMRYLLALFLNCFLWRQSIGPTQDTYFMTEIQCLNVKKICSITYGRSRQARE